MGPSHAHILRILTFTCGHAPCWALTAALHCRSHAFLWFSRHCCTLSCHGLASFVPPPGSRHHFFYALFARIHASAACMVYLFAYCTLITLEGCLHSHMRFHFWTAQNSTTPFVRRICASRVSGHACTFQPSSSSCVFVAASFHIFSSHISASAFHAHISFCLYSFLYILKPSIIPLSHIIFYALFSFA